ncbi:helix-turn-helix domain-containing protein [Pediococcus acidilactici]|uniref:helix-turn-helix domain-containing protein n=1 Tax=Pediococcus acidilactici TaxID=1254 RepID=UPI000FFB087E|nr:helix-turn-helix domain-containing protein [Pediococcus acidilactici]MBW4797624.1 helix-turn-helix domain-containing protein [Pediococcus acidilactici]MBW9306414.1 helix-turn-helix domain-containing protein [Pediococcus acidilactici]MCE5961943.1 helix-turn-helix domain-containing protein [Pediococcus acidilactici]MCW8083045.1 helix-turn-helix domain-containing protein [Pediococcus acidilactici]MDB8857158.1 helix-turn-helix domain-containing protein [Pediococcus acidilactici]
MEFSKVLKKRRKELQITQQALADQLFVTRQTVSRWENGLSYPNLDVLVKISECLEITLDELLKGEGMTVVNKISEDVRLKEKYRRALIMVSLIIGVSVTLLVVLGYGRATQNTTIDRLNPFLTTKIGYGVLPQGKKMSVDTFISDDPFGNGEWLKFKAGRHTTKDKWVLVSHRGSYVSNVRLITYEEVPTTFKKQVGTDYFKYRQKTMGPRVSKKWGWLPFGG